MKQGRREIVAGQTVGRWTVLEERKIENGAAKWLCRCQCGTTRYVMERSLLYGGSQSCGCLRKELAAQAGFTDLTGKTFGELTVLRQVENTGKKRGRLWLCQCSCGEEYAVLSTLLTNGYRTHCPGKAHRRNYAYSDITGQKFECLTALYVSEKRRSNRSVTWHCRCDCGNEIDVPYNNLVHSNMRSCGCRKKAHDQKLKELLTHVDGTSMDMIRSKKIPSDNTTGCRGVYLIKGKYVAKIVFQKKAYYLGSYDSMEQAAKVRRDAEAQLFDSVTLFYEKWKQQAAEDPVWAAANPVRITVSKDGASDLIVDCRPYGLL